MTAQEARGAVERGHTGVRYIGREDPFLDRNYESHLTFTPGQVRHVPKVLADKFLRHSDVFEEVAEAKADAGEVLVAVDDTDLQLREAAKAKDQSQAAVNLRQDVVDQVNTMNKDALQDFAKSKYGQPLNGRKTVEAMRSEVIGFIDQFGLV